MAGDTPKGLWSIWPIRFAILFILLNLTYGLPNAAPFILRDRAHIPITPAEQLICAGVAILLTALLYALLVRGMEKRWPAEIGPGRAVPHFIQGSLIGLGLFSAVYVVLFALHMAAFKGVGSTQDLAFTLGLSLASGVCEEIIFRGVVFRLLEGAMGTLIALILSAALFGLLHAGNKGATTMSTVAIAVEAGTLLALAYTVTRSLWLAIGLHFAWNFTEGGIFGAAISGNPVHGLLDAPISGPAMITGGSFGPEAGLAAIAVCTAAALILLVITIRRGEWVPLRMRLRT
jgi:hypothetical protein